MILRPQTEEEILADALSLAPKKLDPEGARWALMFSPAKNTYAERQTSEEVDLGPTEFTISVRINGKLDPFGYASGIITRGQTAQTKKSHYAIFAGTGVPRISASIGNVSNTQILTTTEVSNFIDYHLMFICSTSDLILMVNGEIKDQASRTITPDVSSTMMEIGRWVGSINHCFEGKIWDGRFWKTPKSIDEGKHYFEDPQAPPSREGLVSWWNMNDGYGTDGSVARDETALNPLTMHGFAESDWKNIGES